MPCNCQSWEMNTIGMSCIREQQKRAHNADLSARVLASDSITLLPPTYHHVRKTSLKVIYFVPISRITKSIQINPDISIIRLVTLIRDDNKETLGATTPEIHRVSAYAYCTAL